MLENIDKIDRKLLYELDKNSRLPLSVLAKKVRCSRMVVEYRLKKFIELGIIAPYVLVDAGKFGLTSWKVYIQFYNREAVIEDVINYLQETKNIWWIVKCEGSFDLLFSILTENVHGFYRFLNDFQTQFNKDEARIEITTHINTDLYSRGYLAGVQSEKVSYTILEDPVKEKVDKTDIEILKALGNNSRIPSTELALQLKTTARIVNYRIKDLVKRRIIPYFRLILNVDKIGMDYYKVMISVKDLTLERQKALKRFFEKHPNITNSSNSWGPWEIEFEAEVENFKALSSLVNEVRERFSDIIKKTEFILLSEELKTKNNFLEYMKF